MGLAPGADGTMNLVAARSTGLNDEARVINSARLLQEPPYQPGMEPYQGTSSFGRVPPGHPWLPGSVNSNRRHVFCEDLDGDGRTEVVTDVNGTWNRVGVWDVNGGPKYLVDFGPRSEFSTHDESLNMGATNVRGLILADLDGDGRQEIVVALWRGLILALNSRCEKVWARRLPSPPTVLAGATLPGEKTPWLVAGCEDGSVLVLNGRGTPIRAGSVPGRPTGIAVLADSKRDPYAAIGTEEGEVRTFQLSRE
jgi:outer membrane protein assembly factor BamB